MNFFQPSFKLAEKHRDGARVQKRYHPPATPYQRMRTEVRTPKETRSRLEALCETLDPVRLLRDIRDAQGRLAAFANAPDVDPEPASLEAFLSSLKTA